MNSATLYEKYAYEYLQVRDNSSIGAKVVSHWASNLSKGAEVIEIACGGGYPVTSELKKSGLQLWALESSPTLVNKFQSRFPNIPIECTTVQVTNFFNRHFDGAVAIGLVFLLPKDEQFAIINRIAKILLPGGRFLFTAPLEVGNWNDRITGLECYSFGQVVYEKVLREAGFQLINTYTDEGANNYYDAEKILSEKY